MTRGQHLIGSLRLKERFHDAHDRRSYLRMVEIAKRIVDDPSLVQRGREYLDRFIRNDPHQQSNCRLWDETLRLPSEEIARQLLSDTPRGAELRESAPVFTVIREADARLIWATSHDGGQ